MSLTLELNLLVREERQGGVSVDAGSQGGGCGQRLTNSGGGTAVIKLDISYRVVLLTGPPVQDRTLQDPMQTGPEVSAVIKGFWT